MLPPLECITSPVSDCSSFIRGADEGRSVAQPGNLIFQGGDTLRSIYLDVMLNGEL